MDSRSCVSRCTLSRLFSGSRNLENALISLSFCQKRVSDICKISSLLTCSLEHSQGRDGTQKSLAGDVHSPNCKKQIIFLIYCIGLAPRCILGAFFSHKPLRENRSHDRFELRFPSLDFHLFEMEGATRSWPAIRLCMRQASCQSVRLSARGFESLPQRHLSYYAAKHLFTPFLPL